MAIFQSFLSGLHHCFSHLVGSGVLNRVSLESILSFPEALAESLTSFLSVLLQRFVFCFVFSNIRCAPKALAGYFTSFLHVLQNNKCFVMFYHFVWCDLMFSLALVSLERVLNYFGARQQRWTFRRSSCRR